MMTCIAQEEREGEESCFGLPGIFYLHIIRFKYIDRERDRREQSRRE